MHTGNFTLDHPLVVFPWQETCLSASLGQDISALLAVGGLPFSYELCCWMCCSGDCFLLSAAVERCVSSRVGRQIQVYKGSFRGCVVVSSLLLVVGRDAFCPRPRRNNRIINCCLVCYVCSVTFCFSFESSCSCDGFLLFVCYFV